MLTVVAMRGVSTSATAFQAAAIRAMAVMFGWCVDDSVFFLLFGKQYNSDARWDALATQKI